MSARKKTVLILLAAALLFGGSVCAWVALSSNPYAATARRYVKNALSVITIRFRGEETEGLPDDAEEICFVDGVRTEKVSIRSWQDSKKVYVADGVTRFVNYSAGYQLDLPENTQFDLSLSPLYITAEHPDFNATVSKERSPYIGLEPTLTAELARLQPDKTFADGTEQYIGYYQNRFLLDEGWQMANGVTVTETVLPSPTGKTECITAVVDEPGEMAYDARTYLYIRGEGNVYYRILFRYDSKNAATVSAAVRQAAASFYEFAPYGTEKYSVRFAPILPDNWAAETASFYNTVKNSDGVRWGVFTADVFNTGVKETIPALEEKLGYDFAVVLGYQHMNMEPLTDFLNTNWENGKVTEYTYQITTSNNLDLFGASPLLETAKGERDKEIRALASAFRAFGHPVLFRLCNEMNSDWVSYGGIINLEDPEIYKEAWRRIYRIFEEEGVNNVIWVFNPNDNNYPPSDWNNYLAYYPGDGYVHMIGVTGYNTGTYYANVFGERWRNFGEIYDEIQNAYGGFFGDYPWMITEFASSSVGGDKAKWVRDMFDGMDKYDNIKIAVWFSYADFDGDKVARPYWMDETEAVVNAFREGLKNAPGSW